MIEHVHRIVTVTPNPALDRATSATAVIPGPKLRCLAPRTDPGGGGINVARVVRILGGDATVVTALGGHTGERLSELLRAAGLSVRAVPIRGETRDSLTVDDETTGRQYRFVLPGPSLTAAERRSVVDAVVDEVDTDTLVVGSGSLPGGILASFWADVATEVRDAGGRMILDTAGESARLALEVGVHGYRCNSGEMEELLGRPLTDEADQDAALRELVDAGRVDFVMMGLGSKGSLLVDADGARRFPAPSLPKRSAVGAGDSLVGGLVTGLARGWTLDDAAVLGVVAAAAAHATPGTELCRRDDVERLFEEAAGKPLPGLPG